MATAEYDGFSTTVDIRLEVDGSIYDVGQVGSRSLLLTAPSNLSAGQSGVVTMTIDGREFPRAISIRSVNGLEVSFS